jgi:hypothetical protein
VLFITIYLPWIWYYDYGVTVGNFDFDSIMIYWSDYVFKKDGSKIYRNDTISPTDADTVKKMY